MNCIQLTLATALLALSPLMAADGSFILRNVTVHPVNGAKIDNATIVVVDGRISEIGAKVASKAKLKVVEGKGLHVWPGLINGASTVGLAEIGSIRETNDTGELGAFNPQLRPVIAVNPESEHIPVTRANGITMTALLPALNGGRRAGGQRIGGAISLAHLAGWTWEEMAVAPSAALHLALPAYAAPFDPATFRPGAPQSFIAAKREHDTAMNDLTSFFDEARAYWTAKKAGATVVHNLKFEAMIPLFEGKIPVVAYASEAREIKETIEFADKQQIKLVLAGVRKPGDALELIAKKKVPVILAHTQTSPDEEDDPYDEPYSLPAKLNEAGVKFCFATFDSQFARNLPYQAAQAVAYGLPYDTALRSVTLTAAEIYGIDKDYGSLEKGKVADFVVTDGDVLDPRTNVKQLYVRGNAVDLETKHTRLYKKYLARP